MNRTLSRFCPLATIAARIPTAPKEALASLSALKQEVGRGKDLSGLDYYRGVAFLHSQDPLSARQAFLEEIRGAQPNNLRYESECWEYVHRIEHAYEAYFALPQAVIDAEPHFSACYLGIFRHSMLHWRRLLSLWCRTREVAEKNVAGDIIECGVAGGGSTVLLAVAARVYFRGGPRRVVYAHDTFSGMPVSDPVRDTRAMDGALADSLGWGTGTCAAPAQCVRDLAAAYGVGDAVKIVVGDFGNGLGAGPLCMAHIDADWYESTKVCLEEIYPRLESGGSLQIDDYHYWDGCRKAVDGYFGAEAAAAHLQEVGDGNAVWLVKA